MCTISSAIPSATAAAPIVTAASTPAISRVRGLISL
jgi:hypothetical protein